MSQLSEIDVPEGVKEPPLRCCQRCYQHAIFISFGLIAGLSGSNVFASFLSQDFNEKFQYVQDHIYCDICNGSFRTEGYDPCDEFQLSNKVECFDYKSPYKGKNLWLRIFHSSLSDIVVGTEGRVGEMMDNRISNWLVKIDHEEDDDKSLTLYLMYLTGGDEHG